MSENHARLRAFKFYYDNGTAVASDELRDAMDLLRDYDGLAARLAEAEALLREARPCLYLVQDDQIAADIDAFLASDRPCTCHPDDNPPRPCPKKYALADCEAAFLGADSASDKGRALYERQAWANATPWNELHEDTRALWTRKATTGLAFTAADKSGAVKP